MEEKREMIRTYVGKGLRLDECLKITKMHKSTYYYRRNYHKGGRTKSTVTMRGEVEISDTDVVQQIRLLLMDEFIDYGYRKVTTYLKRAGYQIGRKKVYRLMQENNLLRPAIIKSRYFDKEIMKTKPKATKPLQIIEIDIKYVYIDGLHRHAYLMTIYDIFHREAYVWSLNLNMRTRTLIELILSFVDQELIEKQIDPSTLEISFRTDNGSQFVSHLYRQLMAKFHFKTVYIPPATPQLNGHIESFHSTVQALVCDKYEFKDLDDAQKIFERFFYKYNNVRYLTCLLDNAPKVFKEMWDNGLIGQKEHKGKFIFFFKEKEERPKHKDELDTATLSLEVNLDESQDFVCSQNKDIVNLPKQIYATCKKSSL